LPSSAYLRDLFKWASEAVETIKATGCEIPSGLGLNQGDLYLGPGSILAIEGAVRDLIMPTDKD
jgi:histone deacetylase HOS3